MTMKNNESSLIRFIKSSGIFFIGSVLSKAISILMLPLYTNRIPTDDMGYYDLSLTYITIATSFLFFDIWVAVLRYMYDGKTKQEQATAIKSGFSIFSVSSLVYLLFGSIFAWIFNPDAILLILLYGLFQNISNFLCFCVRGFQKNKEFPKPMLCLSYTPLISTPLLKKRKLKYGNIVHLCLLNFLMMSVLED